MAGFLSSDQVIYNRSQGWFSVRDFEATLSIAAVAGRAYGLFQHMVMPAVGSYSGTTLQRKAVNGGATPTHAGIITPRNPLSGTRNNYFAKTRGRGISASSFGDLILLDMVAYYPALNLNSNALQTMAQTEAMPRYTDGVGLSLFLDVMTGPVGVTPFTTTVIYRDETNTAQTTTVAVPASVPNKTIAHGANSLFIPLSGTQGGIREVTSMQNSAASGSASTGALVLCKEICRLAIPDITSQREYPPFGFDPTALVQLESNPALVWLYRPSAAPASAQFSGNVECIEG